MRTDIGPPTGRVEKLERNGNSGCYRVAAGSFRTSKQGLVRIVSGRAEIERAWEGLTTIEARGFALDAETGRYLGPVRLSEEGTLLGAAGHSEQPMLVQLEGYAVAYRFAWDPRTPGPPAELRCEAMRQDRRARVSRRVKMDVLTNEASAGREVIQFDVRDVSHGGLGATVDSRTHSIQSGRRIEEIAIRWKGGDVLRASAVVAHVSEDRARGIARCGLALQFSDETSARWRDLVDDMLHPNASRGPLEPRVFWDAYVESGYLSLSGKEAPDFSDERACFEATQRLLSHAPGVGAAFAAGDKNRLEAFAHQLQVWEGSWLWFHLCRLPNGRSLCSSDDQVLVDLYSRAYQYVRAQGAQWLVTYIQKSAGYSRLVHYESALQLEGAGASCVVPFHAFEINCAEADSDLPADVNSASATQLEEVQRLLALEYPALYLDATGLGASGLGIHALRRLWGEHGLERRREVLVACSGNTITATCVLDAASPGLHLYGLLDCARIFVHRSDDGANEVVSTLLRAAASWYRSLGRTRFVYFGDPELHALVIPPRSLSLGEAYLTVHTVETIPQLLERVFVLAAPSGVGVHRRNHVQTT